jgi:preprotein translocase subunit SecD
MLLIAAGLSALQATLTLPGIAGIVLTVGMAVDANVLIFERIREEQRAGRTPISAVDAGYSRALTTIIDANITTFIAAALLFIFGSGPIKGFAVTLMIGLATSMFTAIWVTRLMVVTWLRKRRPQRLPI